MPKEKHLSFGQSVFVAFRRFKLQGKKIVAMQVIVYMLKIKQKPKSYCQAVLSSSGGFISSKFCIINFCFENYLSIQTNILYRNKYENIHIYIFLLLCLYLRSFPILVFASLIVAYCLLFWSFRGKKGGSYSIQKLPGMLLDFQNLLLFSFPTEQNI